MDMTALYNVLQQPQVGLQSGLMNPQPQVSNLPSQVMGPWSKLAYQMAGSPHQGGALPSVAAPAAIPGSLSDPGSSSGGGTGTAILTGLLGAVARNPGLIKGAVSGISGLLGGGSGASVLAGGSPALSAVGTGAVAPAVNGAAADASAALAGTPSAVGGLLGSGAAGGLAGGAGSLSASAGALGAGAPGVFASGSAGAVGGGGAGASLGAAGTAAAVAAPFIAQQAVLALGDAWTKKNTQGNTAMQGWMNSTGAKWVPSAGQSNSGNTFQSQQFANASHPGTMIGPNGQPMSPTDVVNAISAWAQQNGVNPGDFHPVG